MSRGLGVWIHTFAITETSTHKNGYTVYKITSIVFPRSVPEALTCITVWKRFHDIKRLYRELIKRHKALQLRGHIPELKDKNFFKRFDPEVIQHRKEYILQLLDYAAQHPALYKSHPFINFFENGYTPPNSNSPRRHLEEKGNIESICDNLDITFDNGTTPLIDPTKDDNDCNNGGKNVIIGNFKNSGAKQENCVHGTITSQQEEQQVEDEDKNEEIIQVTNTKDKKQDNNIKDFDGTHDITKILTPQISFEGDESDYIYEAAYEFSKAVQAEVNQEYQEAYNRYKCGVDKLLTGSKDDVNEERKFIAKTKVKKYVTRAEEIFEKYLLNNQDKKPTLQLSIDSTDSSEEYLERPWNQLSKFKVMQIIDSVMQVQDVTDKSIYIMKALEKPSTNSSAQSIFLPQGVPYMVRLLGFFQSDTAIYLLLDQAKGGKLFDYIRTYTPNTCDRTSLNELFTEIDSNLQENGGGSLFPEISSNSNSSISNFDSGFIEIYNEYRNGKENSNSLIRTDLENIENDLVNKGNGDEDDEKKDHLLLDNVITSEDIAVDDLLNYSQKLLKCVNDTLEQSKKANLLNDTNFLAEREKLMKKLKRKLSIDCKKAVSGDMNLEKRTILPEGSVKQWAKELLTAIESLHLKGVILGDLHPDNLLLGSKGQLLLSYFHQNEGSGSNLQLLIDTAAMEGLYVAPERPLTVKSDCWSYGVVLFELLTGYTFRSCHPAGLASYFDVQYPEIEISETAKDLLNSVLQYNPIQRYGIDKIKMHPFFEGTNWDEVVENGGNSS